jgi:predicted transcriptional regulator
LAAPTVPLRIEQLDFACRLRGLTSHNQLAEAMKVNRSTVNRALTKGEATLGFIARLRATFPGSTVEDFCSFESAAEAVPA